VAAVVPGGVVTPDQDDAGGESVSFFEVVGKSPWTLPSTVVESVAQVGAWLLLTNTSRRRFSSIRQLEPRRRKPITTCKRYWRPAHVAMERHSRSCSPIHRRILRLSEAQTPLTTPTFTPTYVFRTDGCYDGSRRWRIERSRPCRGSTRSGNVGADLLIQHVPHVSPPLGLRQVVRHP
jgi:hypothetical protein